MQNQYLQLIKLKDNNIYQLHQENRRGSSKKLNIKEFGHQINLKIKSHNQFLPHTNINVWYMDDKKI